MKTLALLTFLASPLAFSHPADLVDSARPACKQEAHAAAQCEIEKLNITWESRLRFTNECHASMNEYLSCEISELRQQLKEEQETKKSLLQVLPYMFGAIGIPAAMIIHRCFNQCFSVEPKLGAPPQVEFNFKQCFEQLCSVKALELEAE